MVGRGFTNFIVSTLCLLAVDGRESYEERHHIGSAPEEKNVDAMETYDQDFMKDMHSTCRPEKDGFFGSTYGDARKLTYGFRLEMEPLASKEEMLDLIEDRIVDNILSETFPEMCGFRRRRELAATDAIRASGYRFLRLQEVEKCDPENNGMNYCGVFTGDVNIYGTARVRATYDVRNMIRDSLNVDDATVIHKDMAKLSVDESQFKVRDEFRVDDIESDDDDGPKNVFGIVCFVLAGLIFAAIVYWKCLSDRKQGDSALSNGRRGLFNRRSKTEYDPSANSIMPYSDDDGISYGRPIEIGSYYDEPEASPTRPREVL